MLPLLVQLLLCERPCASCAASSAKLATHGEQILTPFTPELSMRLCRAKMVLLATHLPYNSVLEPVNGDRASQSKCTLCKAVLTWQALPCTRLELAEGIHLM